MEVTISKTEAFFYIFLAVIGTIIAGALGWIIPISLFHGNTVWVPLCICIACLAMAGKHASKADDIRYGNEGDYPVAYVFLILAGVSGIVFLKSGIFALIRLIF